MASAAARPWAPKLRKGIQHVRHEGVAQGREIGQLARVVLAPVLAVAAGVVQRGRHRQRPVLVAPLAAEQPSASQPLGAYPRRDGAVTEEKSRTTGGDSQTGTSTKRSSTSPAKPAPAPPGPRRPNHRQRAARPANGAARSNVPGAALAVPGRGFRHRGGRPGREALPRIPGDGQQQDAASGVESRWVMRRLPAFSAMFSRPANDRAVHTFRAPGPGSPHRRAQHY
jgi:hypothetical protein